MQKQNRLSTAANTKTMNAVEGTRLFAAADETEPLINFAAPIADSIKTSLPGNKPAGKTNQKAKKKDVQK